MPKPVKIKKPKSFMFTTKHHSFSGVMGGVLGIISIGVLTSSIYFAFTKAGKSSVAMGGAGLFAMILDFIGVLAGLTAMSERDIHKWVPIASMIGNSIVLAIWIALVIYGGR